DVYKRQALYQVRPISPKEPSIGEQLIGVKYRIDISPLLEKMTPAQIEERIKEFLSKKEIPFLKERKGKERLVNLRQFVQSVELHETKLHLDVRIIDGRQIRAKHILSSLLNLDENELLQVRIRKVQNILSEHSMRNEKRRKI
ncbi:MAG: DUF2344 domain-containing protein, partial [Planctomycetota bacterium]|nr:DUF2344 domain-containing protein [Planctomycetota bacterium]